MHQCPAYLLLLAPAADRPRFSDYVAALPPLHAQYGGRFLAVAPANAIEQFGLNGAPQSVMLSCWPSLARLLAFWQSAKHRALTAKRAMTSGFLAAAMEGDRDIGESDSALAIFLGPGPSPALLEAGGARALAHVREHQVEPLVGAWSQGDVAIYGWNCPHGARRQLVDFSSGHRGRSILLPTLASQAKQNTLRAVLPAFAAA